MASVTVKLPVWLVKALATNAKANSLTQAAVIALALRKLFEEPPYSPALAPELAPPEG